MVSIEGVLGWAALGAEFDIVALERASEAEWIRASGPGSRQLAPQTVAAMTHRRVRTAARWVRWKGMVRP